MKAIYGTAKISDFKVNTVVGKKGKATVSSIELDGRELAPTKRFWKSMRMRFKINAGMTRYFQYPEIFDRITKVAPSDVVRYCIEETGVKPKLLALTNPNQPYVNYDSLVGLLMEPKNKIATNPTYAEGIVRSTHNTIVPFSSQIKGDTFNTQFVVDTPIDGFGRPSIYVSLLRLVCANGAIGYSPKFRTEVSVGKGKDNLLFSLERAFESFANEEGHGALISRFETSASTWASVSEAMRCQKLLIKVHGVGGLKNQKPLVISKEMGTSLADMTIFQKFFSVIGDINTQYGVTNIDAISKKKQKTLNTKSTVYELLNFMTEVATHEATPIGSKMLQAGVGDLISKEYDLEGIDANTTDFTDRYLSTSSGVIENEFREDAALIGEDDD